MTDELLQQESLFLNAFHYAPIGMCLFLANGQWIKVNPALCKMVGYTEDELLKMGTKGITHPDDLAAHKEYFSQLLQGEIESLQIEKRYIHKLGNVIWAVLNVSLVCDKKGKPKHLISQIVDITKRKESEERLKQIEELHRRTSINSQDIIVHLTPQGIVNYVSPVVRDVLGYEPEEMIGKNGYAFWHPADMDNWSKSDQDSRTVVFRIQHKKGHYVWHEAKSKKVRNLAGETEHIFTICRDITERKTMELRLKESEQRHHSLLKYTPVGICAIDLTGKFVEVSPSYVEMVGYSMEELLSMTFRNIIHPEILALGEASFETALKGELSDIELVLQHKNGSRIEALASSCPIIIHDETVGVYIITKDVTRQRKTDELLQKAEKLSLVGELAAGIAHEIRNPLTSLRGFIQLGQCEDRDPKRKIRYEVMLSEIDRINEIVSELLVLAKPSNENMRFSSITKKLEDVITLFEGQAHLYNIEIRTDFEEQLPLFTSQGGLKQVFINVLKNAIESMPHGGEVFIQAKKIADQIHIRFTDQGKGIPQDQLTKIGHPFYTTKDTGTGLGLTICHRIVQNHRGSLRIESQEGIGTVVEIILPLNQN